MPTPPDPEPPRPGPVLEPIRVVRPRRFDALAELMREMYPDPAAHEPGPAPPGRPSASSRTPETAEEETRELPPLPGTRPPAASAPRRAGRGTRRTAVALAVAAAALAGFGSALLLTGRQEAAATARPSPHRPTPPSATASPVTTPAPTGPADPTAAGDPDGPGTLRGGDTGPEVTDLQERLLHVPDVYRGGSTSGVYDTTLTEAVARFQLWYGISGDETGVYGDDTRRALESRTDPGDDG
ncbi:Putative peptidoglycan binding domain-containing protein [Streptomyces sp. 1222.5]|uniref:peptidoglycan-binding protein n=1 Tax=unclassified Streptomyces TaxID=2593676 RepID=UPI00089437C7|nr:MULTISPECIES: peptidoglycan-binding domain-containing protein [unclassified Streptomyces]PKW11695.1 putative peptidoglycan binding protein [Streptomyces sp. 5112.2]SEB72282.1 Putative peptidoglycan binding domain-containing protein [Streptomyces sp. 1222.5]